MVSIILIVRHANVSGYFRRSHQDKQSLVSEKVRNEPLLNSVIHAAKYEYLQRALLHTHTHTHMYTHTHTHTHAHTHTHTHTHAHTHAHTHTHTHTHVSLRPIDLFIANIMSIFLCALAITYKAKSSGIAADKDSSCVCHIFINN